MWLVPGPGSPWNRIGTMLIDLVLSLGGEGKRRSSGHPPAGTVMSAKHLQRVRRICATLPEATEKLSHGEPTFFVRKKVFAMFANNHHNDGHIAVWLPAKVGIQAMLIETFPDKFFKPPYVGVRGWIGIELEHVSDEELTFHIREAWTLIAPKRLANALEPIS